MSTWSVLIHTQSCEGDYLALGRDVEALFVTSVFLWKHPFFAVFEDQEPQFICLVCSPLIVRECHVPVPCLAWVDDCGQGSEFKVFLPLEIVAESLDVKVNLVGVCGE